MRVYGVFRRLFFLGRMRLSSFHASVHTKGGFFLWFLRVSRFHAGTRIKSATRFRMPLLPPACPMTETAVWQQSAWSKVSNHPYYQSKPPTWAAQFISCISFELHRANLLTRAGVYPSLQSLETLPFFDSLIPCKTSNRYGYWFLWFTRTTSQIPFLHETLATAAQKMSKKWMVTF